MTELNMTRGDGLLEGFLARQRSRLANTLIDNWQRQGSLLDIGCGNYPFFLINTRFREKHGLDKLIRGVYKIHFENYKIKFVCCDIEKAKEFPFSSKYFDTVTMLAVIEHIGLEQMENIFKEIYRILKPGGRYIITTPAPIAAPLLRLMARIKLVSRIEIDEHKYAYSYSRIKNLLEKSGFLKDRLRFGYFFLNSWVIAIK